MQNLLLMIVLAPLAGAVVTGLFGRDVGRSGAHWIAIVGVGVSFALSALVFFKIVIPTTLPWILTTMRINIGLALIGVITGEFLSSSQGLGYLVDSTAKLYQMSHTIAALVMISIVAAAQFYAVEWLERRLLKWSHEAELEFIT